MKTQVVSLLAACLLIAACQKSAPEIVAGAHEAEDSTINVGDTLSYEVLTSDTAGWLGMWLQPDGKLSGNNLDSGMYGRPVPLPTGWRYTFISPAHPFQALISVAAFGYEKDITVNFYRNGQRIKSETAKAVVKLIVDVNTDSTTGTAANPVLTYEVLVNNPDITKAESDGWLGHWKNARGIYSDADNLYHTNNSLLSSWFAIPSGWRYSFKPDKLPFTMGMQVTPYTIGGGTVTANFYVNGKLVKSGATSTNWTYPPIEYTVQ